VHRIGRGCRWRRPETRWWGMEIAGGAGEKGVGNTFAHGVLNKWDFF
jgi:hypothetical protein